MGSSKGLNNKLAGQIGEYLVCAELGRRGYIATPFTGNVPVYDVLATDQMCRTVPIQVKATRGTSWPSDARTWIELRMDGEKQIKGDPILVDHPNLIYVCVAIANESRRDRFFILTRAELQTVCIDSYTHFMERHNWQRPRNPKSFDNRYGLTSLEEFEDRWHLITSQLDPAL